MSTPPLGVNRCHHPNLDSVVLSYDSPFIQRAFVATGESGGRTVAPHNHRASLRLTVLHGEVGHHTFQVCPPARGWKEFEADLFNYRSVFLGGQGLSGDPQRVNYVANHGEPYEYMQTGDSLVLPHTEIHTVEWSDDAVWLIEEGPVVKATTIVMLRPQDDFSIEGLYEPMSDYEYARTADHVMRYLWEVR